MQGAKRGLAVLFVCLVGAPASAQAATLRVDKDGDDVGDCISFPCETIQFAVDKAQTGETVEIGIGTWDEDVFLPRRMNLIGKGPAKTKIFAPSTAEPGPGIFTNWGGTIASLTAIGRQSTVNDKPHSHGIRYVPVGSDTPLVLRDVVGIGGNAKVGSSYQAGVGLLAQNFDLNSRGALTVTDSAFRPGDGGLQNAVAVYLAGGTARFDRISANRPSQPAYERWHSFTAGLGTVTVNDSTLEGAEVGDATLNVNRSVAISDVEDGTPLAIDPLSSGDVSNLNVKDSLIRGAGINTSALAVQSQSSDTQGNLTLEGSTVVSEGAPGLAPPALSVSIGGSVSVRNSILWNGGGDDAIFTSKPVAITRSFYRSKMGSGAVPAPGTGGNFTGDPGFLAAGSADYRLASTSQLIDRGTAAGTTTDLARAPRSVDGNGDCVAAPDVGAYELQGRSAPCPARPTNIAPAISKFRLTKKSFRSKRRKGSKKKLGTSFKFTLSEDAGVTIAFRRETAGRRAGRKCRKRTRKNRRAKRCTRLVKAGTLKANGKAGANTLKFSGKLKGKAMKAGRYRATLTATDATGLKTKSKSLKLRVLKP